MSLFPLEAEPLFYNWIYIYNWHTSPSGLGPREVHWRAWGHTAWQQGRWHPHPGVLYSGDLNSHLVYLVRSRASVLNLGVATPRGPSKDISIGVAYQILTLKSVTVAKLVL